MARDETGVIDVGAALPSVGDSSSPAAHLTDGVAAPTYALRPWTLTDTQAFWSWIQADPELWQQWTFPAEEPSLLVLTVSLVTAQAQGSRLWAIEERETSRVVGIVGHTPVQRDGSVIVHLAVAPDARGIGRALMPLFADTARQCGIRRFVAQVRTDNPRAKRFCEVVGFQPAPYDVLMMEM